MELNEKLNLWVKITGVNPKEQKTTYTIKFNDQLSDYDIEKMNKRIIESLDYDSTGLFASAYLAHYFKLYLKDRKINAIQIVTDKTVNEYIKDIRKLYKALEKDDAEEKIMNEAYKAMDHYGLCYDKLKIFDVIELRTSATKCIESLETVQFIRGKPSMENLKFITDIYMYDNINFAISAAINGVSLCYIRDEKLEDSYFAFVIKNGENLYLITDKPSYVHPNQRYMKRCPGRDMSKRIESAWFPYSLTNIDMNDMYNSGRYGVHENETDLSNELKENKGIRYTKIGSLETMTQDEAFWTVMMLSLIQDKFYKNEHQSIELSYVGGMISHPAIENGTYDLEVYNNMPHLVLDKIVDPISIDLKYDSDSLHLYDHIVERFKKEVSEEIYNMVGPTDSPLIENQKDEAKNFLALALNDFGTEKDFIYRQKWISRFNMATEIKRLSDEDYNKKRLNVMGFIHAHIENRKEEIINLALKEELVTRKLSSKNTFGYEFTDEKVLFSSIQSFDKWYDSGTYRIYEVGQKSAYTKRNYKCNLTGKYPGIVINIKPHSASDLALLCGITVNELPEELQHWSKEQHYTGNCILSNIDPFDWVINDPYCEDDYKIALFLSKQAYINQRKKLLLKENKFWQAEKPQCFRQLRDDNESLCRGKSKRLDNTLLEKCKKCTHYYKYNK